MIAIQIAIGIAVGIVLAYAIIVNQTKLLAFARWLLIGSLTFAAVLLILYALSSTFTFVGSQFPPFASRRFWEKARILLGIVPIFALAFTATYGMALLAGLIVGKTPKMVSDSLWRLSEGDPHKGRDDLGCLSVLGLGLVMAALNWGLSFPVWAFTPIGHWYDAVDAYGRSNGWQDGLSIPFVAFLWQWVWIPLGAYFLIRRLRRQGRAD